MVLRLFKLAIFAVALFLGCTQIDWTHPKEGNWDSEGFSAGKGYCKTVKDCYANRYTETQCEERGGSFSTDMCENPIYYGYCYMSNECEPDRERDNCLEYGGVFSLDKCPNPEEFCPETNNNPIIRGSLTDTRDGKTYGTVVIGEQTWMSENLNYNSTGSSCYGEEEDRVYICFDGFCDYISVAEAQEYCDDDEVYCEYPSSEEVQENCAKYGRLYEAATTIASASCLDYEIAGCDMKKCLIYLPEQCNNCNYNAINSCLSQKDNERDKGVCPDGWHIPSREEWETLFNNVCYNEIDRNGVGGSKTANYLKATSGWNDYVYDGYNDKGERIFENRSGNGTDIYGFAALPGGWGGSDNYYYYIGEHGNWLISTIKSRQRNISTYEYSFEQAVISLYSANVDEYGTASSVRCVKD